MSRRTVSFPPGTPAVWESLESVVTKVGFWGSVLMPLAYLPVLYAGFDYRLWLLLGVAVLNVTCLLVGHEYARES